MTVRLSLVTPAFLVHIAFSPPTRLTWTFSVQKRLFQPCRNYFQTYLTWMGNLLNVENMLFLIKQTQVHAEKSVGQANKWHKSTRKTMNATCNLRWHVTYDLYTTHAVICSKIADVRGISVHEVWKLRFVYFRQIADFFAHQIATFG